MVNKWTVLGVDANAFHCKLCSKPRPINDSGMEQVNQHVRSKTHKSLKIKSYSSVQLDKPVHIQVAQAEGL